MRRNLAAAGVVMLLAVAPAAAGHAAPPVQLKSMPPIAKGIAAFPRVTGGVDRQAAARINRALTVAERGLGCGDEKGSWRRTTLTTMRGPGYLSLLAYDDWYCGGPYSGWGQVTLVFDLKTGARIDWKELFPPGLIQSAGAGAGGDSQPIAVTSNALWKLYAKAATAGLNDKDCSQVLMNPPDTGLVLWPDAKADGVGIMPADFPHVVEACGPPETLRLAQLKKLGIDAAFLAAIDKAHTHGWYDQASEDAGKSRSKAVSTHFSK